MHGPDTTHPYLLMAKLAQGNLGQWLDMVQIKVRIPIMNYVE